MGDVSVIARRKKDGTVQYGWSGNGGYYSNVGRMLQLWYADPMMVDYLFGLGQVQCLREPLSERSKTLHSIWKTCPTGEPHWESKTERSIFSRIAFVDYGYFYDTDNQWYYVKPGPFRIKIPLEMVSQNLDNNWYEFDFFDTVDRRIVDYMIDEYPKTDPEFSALLSGYDMDMLREELLGEYPLHALFDGYEEIYRYFDDWIVIVPSEDNKEIAGILMRKQEKTRQETIDWPGHPVCELAEYLNPVILNFALSYVGGILEIALESEDDVRAEYERIVPQWFLDQFRGVVGDEDAILRLLKENLSRLRAESPWFNERYERGCRCGRERFFEFMKQELDK